MPARMRRPRGPRLGRRQAETSAVGEQEMYRFDDTSDLVRHHKRKILRDNPGLGELPESLLRERKPQGRRIFDPGAGFVSDWINRYTASNFPFIVGTASVQIIPANPLRTFLLIQNKSASSMYLSFGQSATVFNGIEIVAGGNATYDGGATGGSFAPGDSVHVLGAAANLTGVVQEGIILAIGTEQI